MKKSNRWMLVLLLLMGSGASLLKAQECQEGLNFPPYPVPPQLREKSGVNLPAKVDNSRTDFFPEIINQYSWSCNQASSIGYVLTYELNRARNTSADLPENRYAYLYPWSLLMHKYNPSSPGVSYFDSWEIIKAGGCPNVIDYPYQSSGLVWMSGYDRYYRSMFNRAFDNYSLSVATPEELLVLKRYLYDHFEGSKTGGIVSFQIASGGMQIHYLGDNSPDPGAPLITGFGTVVGHALTVVGYDDNITVDLNADGMITNDIDINNDRVVDLHDYERGALIVVNSWGDWLTRRGKAYVAYSVLARYGNEGGLWNRSVHIPVISRSYQPALTMRVKMSHSQRNLLRIMAGVSADPEASAPDHLLSFPMFTFQGGNLPLYDAEAPDSTVFEFGLDITPLTEHLEKDQVARIFLAVDEMDNPSDVGRGVIYEMEVYNHFGLADSTLCELSNVLVVNNSRTLMSVVRPVRFNKIEINQIPVSYAKAGDYVSVKLEATGAANPAKWELAYGYDESYLNRDFPTGEGRVLMNNNYGDINTAVKLPFRFPFFGQFLEEVIVNKDGAIVFDEESREYPYAIDEELLIRSRKRIVAYGKPMDYLTTDNYLEVIEREKSLIILWHAMVPTPSGSQSTSVACELSYDGTISFNYLHPEWIFSEEFPALLGLSNGDNRLFKQINVSGFQSGKGYNTIQLRPSQLPADLRLDQSGWLFCRPQWNDHLFDIPVRIRDKYNQTATSHVYISTRNLDSAGVLSQNYPNPFTSGTLFSFEVPEAGPVQMNLYDLQGRLVKNLINSDMPAGPHQIEWLGDNHQGSVVPSGVYICVLQSGIFRSKIRVLRMKSSGE